jgi:hypothetical protein
LPRQLPLQPGLRLSAAGETGKTGGGSGPPQRGFEESIEGAVLTLERRRAAASPVLSGTSGYRLASAPPGFWPAACRDQPRRRCRVGDRHPLLERLTPPIPEIAAEYWIIVHRDRAAPLACAR